MRWEPHLTVGSLAALGQTTESPAAPQRIAHDVTVYLHSHARALHGTGLAFSRNDTWQY